MRIKRGQIKNKSHKKLLKQAKGFRMSNRKLYRKAIEAVKHAGSYNFMHRKHRKGQKREEWIMSISAILSNSGISYSKFISGLKKSKIELNRKMLSVMATDNPEHFEALVKEVK